MCSCNHYYSGVLPDPRPGNLTLGERAAAPVGKAALIGIEPRSQNLSPRRLRSKPTMSRNLLVRLLDLTQFALSGILIRHLL